MARRKVDAENRQFNSSWTEQFCFVFDENAKKPICLICSTLVSVNKTANLKRHYLTHERFENSYPLGSATRSEKIKRLKDSRSGQVDHFARFTSTQKRSTEASLKVSAVIGKAMLPYSHGPVIKECIVTACKTLFPDRTDLAQEFSNLSLSRNTITNRIEDLGAHISSNVLQSVRQSGGFSLALDESTDKTDMAQLSLFVRYFDKDGFSEKYLTLIPLSGQTTGQVIHERLTEYLRSVDLSLHQLISVSTDGAPAMTGRENGLEGRLKRENNNVLFVHCIIHQTVLCAKLSTTLKETMNKVMKLINFLRAQSSLRHRELRAYLEELECDHSDLLLHSEVRWLSKGRCLERFSELKDAVVGFLSTMTNSTAQTYHSLLHDNDFLTDLAFLNDIFSQLNKLNTTLQGKQAMWFLLVAIYDRLTHLLL